MCLHLVAFIIIFILPKFIKSSEVHPTLEPTLSTSRTYNDSIDNKVNFKPNNEINTIINNDNDRMKIKHNDSEIDILSKKIKEGIGLETKNFEKFIDKTVTGIVELKDDLMRSINDNEKNNLFDMVVTSISSSSLSSLPSSSLSLATSATITTNVTTNTDGLHKRNITVIDKKLNENNDTFLKKEIDAINAAVQQTNVLPAVLSNGHAK